MASCAAPYGSYCTEHMTRGLSSSDTCHVASASANTGLRIGQCRSSIHSRNRQNRTSSLQNSFLTSSHPNYLRLKKSRNSVNSKNSENSESNFWRGARATAEEATESEESSPEDEDFSMGEEKLNKFFDLHVGQWKGNFTLYSSLGLPLHRVAVQVSATAHQSSLSQLLRVRQAASCHESEKDKIATVWRDVEMDETNRFTVDRRQQLGFFEPQKAYAAAHQTAELLDSILKIGVLGSEEEDETDSGIKFPSRRPALVSESTLFSVDGGRRIRAFHVFDPRGVLDTTAVFHEYRLKDETADVSISSSLADNATQAEEDKSRLEALIGEWEGEGVIQRSGLYGATSVNQPSRVVYRREDDGSLVQEIGVIIGGSMRHMVSRAKVNGSLLVFNGLQTTLLPGGVSMSCPSVIARGQAFYVECGWMESAGKRRRILRTFDTDGMVVSTAVYTETKRE